MYIIYVNYDSVIKQICQLRDKAFLINETMTKIKLKRVQKLTTTTKNRERKTDNLVLIQLIKNTPPPVPEKESTKNVISSERASRQI